MKEKKDKVNTGGGSGGGPGRRRSRSLRGERKHGSQEGRTEGSNKTMEGGKIDNVDKGRRVRQNGEKKRLKERESGGGIGRRVSGKNKRE